MDNYLKYLNKILLFLTINLSVNGLFELFLPKTPEKEKSVSITKQSNETKVKMLKKEKKRFKGKFQGKTAEERCDFIIAKYRKRGCYGWYNLDLGLKIWRGVLQRSKFFEVC